MLSSVQSLSIIRSPFLLSRPWLEEKVKLLGIQRPFFCQKKKKGFAISPCPYSPMRAFCRLISDLILTETMYYCHHESLLYLKVFIRTSPIPRLCVHLNHIPLKLASKYTTDTSISKLQSFRVSYFVNNCGFSPETASELSRHASFVKLENPDAILELLRSLNISASKIRDTIKRAPWLLSSDPVMTISPKLEFFKSKGASTSQLAILIGVIPRFLWFSLKNQIIPCYDLINSFLHSDERTLKCITRCPNILGDYQLEEKVKLLRDYGVPQLRIARLLHHWPGVINFNVDKLKREIDEVNDMGFHPSKTTFIEALRTKLIVSKSSWERKVELYRRWGWSDETILKVYIKRPFCVLTSERKIESVMEFFVNSIGWGTLVLADTPQLLNMRLEKRIIPRAYVLQFLLSRGLIKKASGRPFLISEEMFLQKFVNCFKDEAPQISKLYEEKLNLSR